MLLKPFAGATGAAILPDNFFLILVYGTLIYAFRHARSLAICLTVLGVATVTLRLLADLRGLLTSDPGASQPGIEFHRDGGRDGRDVF